MVVIISTEMQIQRMNLPNVRCSGDFFLIESPNDTILESVNSITKIQQNWKPSLCVFIEIIEVDRQLLNNIYYKKTD